ncbi:MAG: type II secretion system secretin GspD [Desulfatibacillaceae bacterium]
MRMRHLTTLTGISLIIALFLLAAPHMADAARITGAEPARNPPTGRGQSQTPQPRTQAAPQTVQAPAPQAGPGTEARPQAEATAGEEAEERMVSINMDNVDIQRFIEWVSKVTGKNFVVDHRVKGNVTIISPTRVSVEEAYKVFESVLEVRSLAAVDAGPITKIIPAPDARGTATETRTELEVEDPEDRIVTQLIPLRYADANEIKKLFAPLISKSSVILSYPATNTIIVTDVLSNIKKLLNILDVIDVIGVGQQMAVIPLEHGSSVEMVKLLNSLFQRQARKGQPQALEDPIRIVSDERTNSIIIIATEEDSMRIRQLIHNLDKEVPRASGRIHVYYLQNATAEDVAKTLQNLPGKQAGAQQKKSEQPVISKDVQISADKATNSLIMIADRDDYVILEDVIKKLDIPRAMVYIEALIMEVATTKNFELGVEWRGASDFEADGRPAGAFLGSGGAGDQGGYDIFPTPTVTGQDVSMPFPPGFSVGVLGEAIQIGQVMFPTLGAVVRAYMKDSDVHILSTPQVLTTNNEEAEIVVGKNVPYITRAEQTASGVDYSQYEYKDVGVTLKITPQISQERLVRLKVHQEVTRLIDQGETTRPTTFKRSTDTTVIVQDGNTVVLGGLIDESTEGGLYKVPCLGDIPLLGHLFRSTSESREKTNLYVFLTPRIIENPGEARAVYEDKKEEIESVEESVIKLYDRKIGITYPFPDEQPRVGNRMYEMRDYEKETETVLEGDPPSAPEQGSGAADIPRHPPEPQTFDAGGDAPE